MRPRYSPTPREYTRALARKIAQNEISEPERKQEGLSTKITTAIQALKKIVFELFGKISQLSSRL
ncbi:MAG: hypothetical protein CBB68_13995 [Rhodospirillaceae bacterium TMED8]|nr:hypothetical protein [Magnetovibrio sp.]OUT48073.1 MAG: hypothetical protein CBB68_13995 [Rhodospirillaceae bacterium TMED8]